MILTNTTFILGAGSSVPFNYPAGGQLRRLLIEQLQPDPDRNNIAVTTLKRLDFTDDVIRAFRDSLLRSATQSVDEFLEHRPEFISVGKAAIAEALVRHENSNVLFNAPENWYQHLFGYLNSKFEDFAN